MMKKVNNTHVMQTVTTILSMGGVGTLNIARGLITAPTCKRHGPTLGINMVNPADLMLTIWSRSPTFFGLPTLLTTDAYDNAFQEMVIDVDGPSTLPLMLEATRRSLAREAQTPEEAMMIWDAPAPAQVVAEIEAQVNPTTHTLQMPPVPRRATVEESEEDQGVTMAWWRDPLPEVLTQPLSALQPQNMTREELRRHLGL